MLMVCLVHQVRPCAVSSIRRENILVWLSWSCFNLPLEQTTADPTRREAGLSALDALDEGMFEDADEEKELKTPRKGF